MIRDAAGWFDAPLTYSIGRYSDGRPILVRRSGGAVLTAEAMDAGTAQWLIAELAAIVGLPRQPSDERRRIGS
jgi:hypothetical protein